MKQSRYVLLDRVALVDVEKLKEVFRKEVPNSWTPFLLAKLEELTRGLPGQAPIKSPSEYYVGWNAYREECLGLFDKPPASKEPEEEV